MIWSDSTYYVCAGVHDRLWDSGQLDEDAHADLWQELSDIPGGLPPGAFSIQHVSWHRRLAHLLIWMFGPDIGIFNSYGLSTKMSGHAVPTTSSCFKHCILTSRMSRRARIQS